MTDSHDNHNTSMHKQHRGIDTVHGESCNICLRLRDCQCNIYNYPIYNYKHCITLAAMLYRQQVKDVKRTEEENVKWLDNFDNYKQHKKQLYWFTGTILFMFYWLK